MFADAKETGPRIVRPTRTIPIMMMMKLVSSFADNKDQCDSKGAKGGHPELKVCTQTSWVIVIRQEKEIEIWYRHRDQKWVIVERFLFDRREVS